MKTTAVLYLKYDVINISMRLRAWIKICNFLSFFSNGSSVNQFEFARIYIHEFRRWQIDREEIPRYFVRREYYIVRNISSEEA